jgi:hypothetical protein
VFRRKAGWSYMIVFIWLFVWCLVIDIRLLGFRADVTLGLGLCSGWEL